MTFSKRFQTRANREIHRDSFIEPWGEKGLVLMNGPSDPKPQIKMRDGRVVELDGKSEIQFDLLDRFIAQRAIDPDVAEQAMKTDSLEIARFLVDIHVPRSELIRLASGMSPAKMVEVGNNQGPRHKKRAVATNMVPAAATSQSLFFWPRSWANAGVLRSELRSRSFIRRLRSLNPSSRALRKYSMARSVIPARAKSSAKQ